MKIALLHDARALDGRPDEQDAMMQANTLEAALRAQGHSTWTVSFGLDLQQVADVLRGIGPDVVVNLVEAVAGQGRLIHLAPALLDSLGIPYTGVGTAAMFLTSHKVWTKRVVASLAIATPAWIDAFGGTGGRPVFPGRYIVKSVWEDASLGLDDHSVLDLTSLDEVRSILEDRRPELGGEAFAEAWIEGREFNLSLLEEEHGPTVLPAAEMCFVDYPPHKPQLVGYRAKWDERSFEYGHTVRRFDFPSSDRALLDTLEALSLRCWHSFELRGYARVDFRVHRDGTPFVLEINANPCLSPDAGFAAAAARVGLDTVAIAQRIVQVARTVAPASFDPHGARSRVG